MVVLIFMVFLPLGSQHADQNLLMTASLDSFIYQNRGLRQLAMETIHTRILQRAFTTMPHKAIRYTELCIKHLLILLEL